MTKRIVLFLADEVQPLDIAGPAAAFAQANENSGQPDYYALEFVSPHGGPVASFSGLPLLTRSPAETDASQIDTLLMAGHKPNGTRDLIYEQTARSWFTSATKTARRWGSVCGGAYVLAAWNLIDSKRVATHWWGAARLQKDFPDVCVDPDALYVTDGNLWTSAGVTAGIDMALAMIEADLGAGIAAQVARHLVVYMRRPGSQAQFSDPLRQQSRQVTTYDDLLNWAKANLDADLSVESLAEKSGQSLRTFQRKFAETTGQTPAAAIENLRLEHAKALLASDVPLKTVAEQIGFRSASQLSVVFRRRFGVSPGHWKTMHGG